MTWLRPSPTYRAQYAAIERQVGEGDEELLKLIRFIRQDSMRGSDMIRDFVDNEFLESSQVVLNKVRLNIARNISVMMENYKARGRLIAKEFRLISPEKPVFIHVDDMKFMQVMNNLVSNAIKFTQDSGVITVSVEENEERALITVSDNGVGIPKAMQPYLFDRFTKARRLGVRVEKSVGLGMSIIKAIVELHGDSTSFESRENVSTSFFISIPKE